MKYLKKVKICFMLLLLSNIFSFFNKNQSLLIVDPLHRTYNLDNPGSVYNKDEFRFGCSFCELFTRDAGSERFEFFGIKKYVG